MLAYQKVRTSKCSPSIEGRVITGCPQDGVLSPHQLKVVINELLDEIGQGWMVLRYANDQFQRSMSCLLK